MSGDSRRGAQLRPKAAWWSRGCLADAALLVLAVVIGFPSLVYPFGIDQALFDLVGSEWLLGKWPYAAVFDNKPPGIFVSYLLAHLVSGGSQMGIRLFDLLIVLSIGWLLGGLIGGRERVGWRGGGAALSSSMYFTCFNYWHSAQVESWQALWLTLALCVLARERKLGLRAALGAGALCGVAFMYKYSAILPAAALWLLGAARNATPDNREESVLKTVARFTAAFSLGAAAAVCAFLLPFALVGHLSDWWEATIAMNMHYSGGSTFRFGELWKFASRWGFPWSIGVLVAVVLTGVRLVVRRESLRWAGWGVVALFLGGLGAVIMQRRFFIYHFAVLVPATVGVFLLAMGWFRGNRVPVAFLVLLAVLGVLFSPEKPDFEPIRYRNRFRLTVRYLSGKLDVDSFAQSFIGFDGYSYAESREVGRFLRDVASDDATLCVRGFQPMFYLQSGLRCPSRFVATHLIYLGEYLVDKPGIRLFRQGALAREYEADLRSHPPTYMSFRGRPPAGYRVIRSFRSWHVSERTAPKPR